MKRKLITCIILVAIIMSAVFILIGCDNDPSKYTITFDSQRGTDISEAKGIVNSEPTPTRAGYAFAGWYTDMSGEGNRITFPYSPASDVTLYAIWTPNSYIVAYNGNRPDAATSNVGGSTSNSSHSYGVARLLTANGYELTGWKFVGWNTKADGSGTSYSNGQNVINLSSAQNGTVNLYAQWEFTYTVIYNSNRPVLASTSIIGSTANSEHTYNESRQLNTNEYSLEGWVFTGWNTQPDGYGTSYTNGQTVGNLVLTPYGSITLYAQWETTYTIIYDSNKPTADVTVSGSTANSTNIKFNEETALRSNGYSILGWSFEGWSTQSNGSVTYTNGQIVKNLSSTPGATIILYAKWKIVSYTVTYNSNKPSSAGTSVLTGSTANSEHTYNVAKTLTTNGYTLEGWTFNGWNTTSNGGGTSYSNNQSVTNLSSTQGATVILYAQWTQATANLNYIWSETLKGYIVSGGGATSATSITIPESHGGGAVVAIADGAFRGYTSLKSISIPNSIKSIGKEAFYGCTSLTGITIPSGVTIIGNDTFINCTSLTDISILGNVTIIGDRAFDHCTSLKAITIPYSVISIGVNAFDYCTTLKNISVPNSVNSIGNYAFAHCISITSVTLSNNITAIADSTFDGCTSLTTITIPINVTTIGESAFVNCTSLKSILIPTKVTEIKNNAFASCTLLSNIIIPSNVTNMGSDIFDECDSLTIYAAATSKPAEWSDYWNSSGRPCNWGIIIGTGATYIESSGAQYVLEGGIVKLTRYIGTASTFSIPTTTILGFNVTVIDTYAFADCASLTSITIPNNITKIGNNAFVNCTSLKSIAIHNLVTEIGKSAFAGCTSLATVTISDTAPNYSGITKIEDSVFANCTSLTSITLPASLQSIGISAFENCKALTNIKISGNLISIGDNSFKNCALLTSITLPASLQSIGNNAFIGCKSLTIYVQTANNIWGNSWNPDVRPDYYGISATNFIELPGAQYIIENNEAKLTRYTGTSSSFTVQPTIKVNSTDIKVTEIGEYAFSNCTILVTIAVSNTTSAPSNLLTIGNNAFEGCTSLTTVSIPSSVTTTGGVSSTIGVTYIGKSAFAGCTSLTTVTLPASLKDIDEKAFENCSKLTRIDIPGSIANSATVTGTSGVTYIGESAFAGCTSLTTVTIGTTQAPSNLNSINESTFAGCTSLTSITLPASLQSIGIKAFENCSKLTSITIPANVTTIGESAFAGCTLLATVTISNTVPTALSQLQTIGVKAFENCKALRSIILPSGVTVINNSTFAGCTLLSSIKILGNVTSIGNSAFSGCTSLAIVTILDGTTGMIIPASVKSIGDSAFAGCTSLTNITLPANVESLGEKAFENCSKLTSITISVKVTSIGADAFSGCTLLTVYAEAANLGSWNINWNSANRTVLWGCKLDTDKTYVVSFSKSTGSIENPTAANGIKAPYREGFNKTFNWKVNGGTATYSAANVNNAAVGEVLDAIWT